MCVSNELQEATLALNEALHIAQQSNDHVALAHTLATLTSLLDAASPALAPAVQETRGLPGPHTKHLQLLRLLRRCPTFVSKKEHERVVWPAHQGTTITLWSHGSSGGTLSRVDAPH